LTISTGVFKKLNAKLQSALGTIATVGSAQTFRRVKSTIDKKKAGYKSNEILPSQQRRDFRHGLVSVAGTISGELSPGTYQGFVGSALRNTWAAAVSSGALTDVTAASTTGAAGTFTTVGANWLTIGFKIGMVIRWTGWTTTGAPNNAHNFLITALTATVMTGIMLDGVAVGAKAAGDSVTALQPGKSISIAQTSHTRDYWTIEHWHSDLAQGEVFTDCVINGMNVKMPASGLVTVDFPVLGLNMTPGTAEYFTTPAAPTTTGIFASANGAVYVQGVKVGNITSFDPSIKGNMKPVGGVVGTNLDPDIYPAPFDVDGTMTVLFDSVTMRDYFLAETEVQIILALTTDNTATAGFMVFSLPRCKVNDASKDDGETGLKQTVPFVALENTAGGTGTATVATTIAIYDSAAV